GRACFPSRSTSAIPGSSRTCWSASAAAPRRNKNGRPLQAARLILWRQRRAISTARAASRPVSAAPVLPRVPVADARQEADPDAPLAAAPDGLRAAVATDALALARPEAVRVAQLEARPAAGG